MSNGLKRRDMRPIQKWGVDRVYDHEATILAWDMGAGKTVTVLTAMDDLLEDRVIRRVLIVAPLLVASATFPDEFEEWSHLSHIDWTLIRAEDEDEDIVAARQKAYRMARDLIGLEPAEAAKFANRHKSRAKEWKRRRLAAIKSEVQRYLVNPGQATAYKVGMIRIQELRRKAEAELGDKFDIRGFHDAVLGGGALPLDLLERRVDGWIADRKNAA